MKFLILCLLTLTLQLSAMDKIFGKGGASPRKEDKKEKEKSTSPTAERHKKEKEERPRTPRDDKQKHAADDLRDHKEKPGNRDAILTRVSERRRGSDVSPSPDPKSDSPSKGSPSPAKGTPSPLRASTLGKKRGSLSLDWADALKHTFRNDPEVKQAHAHMDDSIKKWKDGERAEEELAKMYEEAQLATPRTRRIMLCQIMTTPSGVSQTKVKVATDIYQPHYEEAKLAIYNLPGYISSNPSGDQLKIEANRFHKAFSAALAAYADSLLAAGPKREKHKCEYTAKKSPNSDLGKLWAEYKALKKKHSALKQYLEPEIYALPEPKKP